MTTLHIAGALMVLFYVPLVILVFLFLSALRKINKDAHGLIFSIVCALTAAITFVGSAQEMAMLYSAIQDGVMPCLESRGGLSCGVAFSVSEDLFDYWALVAIRYGLSVFLFALSLLLFDVFFDYFKKQS